MNKRAFRYPTLSVVVSGLLLLSVGASVAAESPRRTRRAREAFRDVAPPQTIGCQNCALVFGECDEAVTLRSEDLVEWGVVSMNKEDACHGWVSCQPNYPSCGNWSPYYACGEPSCVQGSYDCLGCDEQSCPPPPDVLAHHSERFRVCFDQFHNACTEWMVDTVASCDECG